MATQAPLEIFGPPVSPYVVKVIAAEQRMLKDWSDESLYWFMMGFR